MSGSTIELVQQMLGAYVSGDHEALRSIIDPEGEIYGGPGLINSGSYVGYEGFRQWIGQWEDAWDEVTYDLGEPIEVGSSTVVVPAHIVARGAGSGLEIDSVFGWLFQFRDGRAVRYHAYVSLEEALEAAETLTASR